jgi:hypothetical protein
MSGVSVVVQGKSGGTQTNSNGEFSIEAAEGDILVFSSSGYGRREARVGAGSVVDMSLEPIAGQMEDVIVTGYGTQKRKEVTGAVSTVNPKAYEFNPTTNVATVLQGNVPGLSVQQRTGQPMCLRMRRMAAQTSRITIGVATAVATPLEMLSRSAKG